jgi:hypothetical protein
VVSRGEDARRVGGVVGEVGDQAEHLGGVAAGDGDGVLDDADGERDAAAGQLCQV